MKSYCPKVNVSYIACGQTTNGYLPGDFILVSNSTWIGRLVQFGQSLRSNKKQFTRWNHCAMIVNPQGELVEANGRYVQLTTLADYLQKDYYIVNIQATNDDRHEAVAFALSCVGQQYGWMTIFSVALSLLTGLKFSFGFDGQEICSGLVTRALERTSFIPSKDASHMTPFDLAQCYLPS